MVWGNNYRGVNFISWNIQTKRRRGAQSREVKKTNTRNMILTNLPSWNRLVAYVEWTKFCEIGQMNKRNVCQFFSFFFSFSFFFFFFMQYLPPSWLGRVTRRQLFNSRTTRHIDCHKNIRNAGNCRHTLREWSLVTGIVLFHISVYQLRSPQKGNSKTDFTSIEFSI